MDLLGDQAIKSIADLCGVTLKDHNDTDEEKHDFEDKTNSKECEKTNYVIRRGNEADVLKDIKKCIDPDEVDVGGGSSDYTYEEFVAEFQSDVNIDNLYDDDVRQEVDYQMMEGGTYQAGNLPDKQYLTVRNNFIFNI